MTAADTLLPPGFAALEPFAADWAIAGAHNRLQRRLSTGEADRVAFFEAAKGIVPRALEYLDTRPLDGFDEREQRLMNLTLAFAHIALAVEIQRDQEAFHATGARRITITRATADSN
jgi:hypothetical protein